MRLGVLGVDRERIAVRPDGLGVARQIVVNVTEVEVRLEAVGIEADRALVDRFCFEELVARRVARDIGLLQRVRG